MQAEVRVWGMQAYFRPELLNRLDEVVVFRKLDKQSVRYIADLVLAETAAQLNKQHIKLEIAPAVMAKIVEEGYDQVCCMLCKQAEALMSYQQTCSNSQAHDHLPPQLAALLAGIRCKTTQACCSKHHRVSLE